MKLIDLLVKELPKRGGWPDENYKFGNYALVQGHQGAIYRAGGGDFLCTLEKADDWETAEVSRVQYESALAASQKVEWSGDGLPPVGCECEYSLNGGGTWFKCKIDYILGTQGLIMLADVFEGAQYVPFDEYAGKLKFRPLRSEADKRRDESLRAIYDILYAGVSTKQDAADIYDAIAAGKIPGVKLED